MTDHELALIKETQQRYEVLVLAAQVRRAQKAYFATRGHVELQASKALERRLDVALGEMGLDVEPQQTLPLG